MYQVEVHVTFPLREASCESEREVVAAVHAYSDNEKYGQTWGEKTVASARVTQVSHMRRQLALKSFPPEMGSLP